MVVRERERRDREERETETEKDREKETDGRDKNTVKYSRMKSLPNIIIILLKQKSDFTLYRKYTMLCL